MQDDLFGTGEGKASRPSAAPASPAAPSTPTRAPAGAAPGVQPAAWPPELYALAAQLPPTLRLGTSTWSYPGWAGLVWDGVYSEQQLAHKGLAAYARHPLLRTVGIDRGFYRPLSVSDFARYAAQVPEDFRFVVKAPSLVTDALVRSEGGRGREANPGFLDGLLATNHFVAPALEGLGARTGALVFQLSPLPWALIDRLPEVLERLRALLATQPPLRPAAPDGVLAVEVRDAAWLAPEHLEHFADVLKSTGATYCLGLHARMPPLAEQLPLLRRLWPGPLVARWNLNPVHGARGYDEAEHAYAPYDRIHDPAPEQHALLARTLAGVCGHGQNAFVTISNHAEGCAPLTAQRLAQAVVDRLASDPGAADAGA
ncbi:DUF72 domain-containing protein [Melaminivora sp.]|uniref:DUF72 domain-containing protein n=1 Tax=Melaminivora sp. TaxID=1933032 RepID=UPI0028B20C2A|nr:DUF72 domain-containing protein [Melaminivora sp.]